MHTKLLGTVVSLILFIAFPWVAAAGPHNAFVAEFTVAGAADSGQLKATLPRILASRLDPGQVRLVEGADQAELLLTGSYGLFGKLFTIDVSLKNLASGAVTMVFEQGEGADDLLPAVGRLAQKIDRELAKLPPAAWTTTLPASSGQPIPVPSAKMATASPGGLSDAASTRSAGSYVIRSESNGSEAGASDQLDGVFTGIALGRTLASGEREIFVASEHSIRTLRRGAELKQVGEVAIPLPARIIAIDSADLDHDGIPELYVSIVDRDNLSSRVYQPTENGLVLLAENQPWFFRGNGDDWTSRTISVQKMDTSGGFYHGIAELVKTGNRFETGSGSTEPRTGNIFNSTRFRDKSGVGKVALLDAGGHLAVLSPEGRELWKSSEKYGGSETCYQHLSNAPVRSMGDEFQRQYLEQRITPLANGAILVPHNEGSFIGSNRSYDKYSLHALKWTGSVLKEVWHTQQVPGYLADYAYDPLSHELYLLEVVQKGGFMAKGNTVISINRVE